MLNVLRRIVERNCISKKENALILEYWSDVVFAKCVFILAPLSLLAIIPAIIICLQTESYLILWFDVFCFGMLIFVGYTPGISVRVRKILLISLMFITAFVLLKELGNFGPGLVYLLAAIIFSLLLFPSEKTTLPFVFLLLFSVIYGFLIHYNYVEIQANHDNYLMEWIAVSSNVLFMSAVFTLIIPFFFSKLEGILKEKIQLLESVHKTNIELNKALAEVNSKNIEMEQFAFIASHDLQEPLRMVHQFMDKLKNKYSHQLDDKAHQYIHFATDGAKHMKQIILDLLDYSRAVQSSDSMEPVDLNQILSDFKQLRGKVILEKSVTISNTQLPTIFSTKVAITQVFHSLLDNAIKYSKEGVEPHIEINAIENKDEWKFFIKDNGIGIDSEFFDKIFIIFQRLHNRNQYSGTGIGLSVAKKYVEAWGGELGLTSTLGKGTTFYFTVPKSGNITKI